MTTTAMQPSFDELSPALPEVTFVVVDLETTGSTGEDTITEFGAVKVRGGEVLAEFQTLVNPNGHIPALISVLTGITDTMVADAPKLAEVLPSWLEFAGDAVLVAHNAGFDIGFLKRACAAHGYPWPGNQVVDTVALARSVLLRDEVPNVKLGTLARLVRSSHEANHRALCDARVTVDVLHYLLERVGNLGVGTLADLADCTHRVSPERRAKRRLAEGLPSAPGIYQFVADLPDSTGTPRRQVLYVGKSRSLRQRVRSYFTAAETRPRIDEMVRIATGVETTVCRTELEAEVLELRLIAAHAPRYNRRSKFPERQHWVKVTEEPFPRLSIVRAVGSDRATYFGPFSRRSAAEQIVAALHDAYPIRQCTARLSARAPSPACALAELGRCCAPCQFSVGRDEYAALVEHVREALTSDVRPVLEAIRPRLRSLVAQQRFEEAGQLAARLQTYLAAARRHHRLASLAGCRQLVAARRIDSSGSSPAWEVHVVRYGRLAAAALAHPGESPQAVARAAVLAAETVLPAPAPAPAATIEETERIAAWLELPGVRLIEVDGDWSWPLHASIPEDRLPSYALGDLDQAAADVRTY
ncbi:MAG: DEDD exonuclease domain-containing protein [Propionicimonas sp.]|uniref:DEDD exonuclease domain-containing protein n=1 Tax=Propionicimonas sp. TaxID=1955623 RepID=UPI002B21A898|nr:DEDD exonuclease domain-containing protein [Propionicimonas sp.]MEA4945546.1 DEDD exonuclease domain-containing protein [Propionicimonas sp.]MEA5118894.1 DEDD exonuclease domain-containing protein [Propionicimonas sp.]